MFPLLERLVTAAMVVGIVWIALHYRFGTRARPAGPVEAPGNRTLVELAEIADRLETRVQTLERLLDSTTPEWRKQA